MDFNRIPEYAEAVASERKDRALAFLGLPETIAGVYVPQFTALHWEWLRAHNNPFVCGGLVTDKSVIEFLYFTRDGYKFDIGQERHNREEFIKDHLDLDVEEARADIDDYLDRAFLDAPHGPVTEAFYSVAASLCYQMAKNPFRWQHEATVRVPIALIYQLIKARDRDEGCTVLNRRSGKVKADWTAGLHVVTGATREEFDAAVKDMEAEGMVMVSDPNPERDPANLSKFRQWSVAMARRIRACPT